MQGYQFANMEMWSRKGSPGASPEDPVRRRQNNQRAWTAPQIFDEAERVPGASEHVKRGPFPPEIVPGTLSSLGELRDAHEAAASIKEAFPYTAKDGTIAERKRRLRADAPSLHSVIISLPVEAEAALADPKLASECRALLGQAMAHEAKRVSALGGQTALGVIHWDEGQVHMHVLSIDPERGRVGHLHPGRVAKDAFHAHPPEGMTKKAQRKAGNIAYCNAMKAWQDELHEDVFRDAGLLRVGPKKERLSRADYLGRAEEQERQAKERAHSKALAAEIGVQEKSLAEILAKGAEDRADLKAARNEMAFEKIDALVHEGNVATREALAARRHTEGDQKIAEADAFQKAADRGVSALEAREIEHAPATGERREGLRFGPRAPEDAKERHALRHAIQPAMEWLIGIARRFAKLHRQEDALEKREADAARAERQQRHRATVIAGAEERAGRDVSPALKAIGLGRAVEMTETSFPGAWALRADVDTSLLGDRLDVTTNSALRNAWLATSDAVEITADAGSNLTENFVRGRDVLEACAGWRGFDLESGVHDPAKATDPSRANLHTDQVDNPIRVKRPDRSVGRLL